MKSFVLLGLVATGLAIPLTNTPAALDAADADTERAFKTGLAAIEKSLLDVSLTTHQREPTVVAQAKKCSWCGTSTSSTIPGYTGPEKIETIKNVNNDLCCLTCLYAKPRPIPMSASSVFATQSLNSALRLGWSLRPQ